jgi:hypothetical protein
MNEAICDLRFAICDLRFAICDLRFAICDLRFAICDLRFAICDLGRLRGGRNLQSDKALGFALALKNRKSQI